VELMMLILKTKLYSSLANVCIPDQKMEKNKKLILFLLSTFLKRNQ